MNKEKSEKKPTTRKRAPRSPKSVRLIVERHYIGNVPMNTLFQRLAEEEIRKTAESYLAAGSLDVLLRKRACIVTQHPLQCD